MQLLLLLSSDPAFAVARSQMQSENAAALFASLLLAAVLIAVSIWAEGRHT